MHNAFHSRSWRPITLLSFFALFVLLLADASAQTVSEKRSDKDNFCSSETWKGDRASFRESRELTIPSTGTLNVDGGMNGGVRVVGTSRSDVSIRACITAWGDTEDSARSLTSSIQIGTAGQVKATGPADSKNWSVSYLISVPRNTDLNLSASNGGIGISAVEGNIQFTTQNGGVSLSDLAGSVKGRTTNGGVRVSLTGSSWKGTGLDVETTNGSVNLSVPDGYSANVEMATTNGGFRSDVPSLNVDQEDVKGDHFGRRKKTSLNTVLNGGGAPIRVVTTNGGVRIGPASKE